MSICPLCSFADKNQPEFNNDKAKDYLITDGIDIWKNFNRPHNLFIGCAFGKLYKKELFDNVRYPEGHYVEDNAIIHYLIYPCEKIVILDKPMYGYRLRTTGIMGSAKRSQLVKDIVLAFEDRRHFFIKMGHSDIAELVEKEMYYHLKPHLETHDKDTLKE